MTTHRVFLLGVVSLVAFAECQAAEKEFLLSGTRWRLEDVSTEVAVQFQSLRTNRATGGWNAAVKLLNNGTRDLYTPLVLSIESYTGTTGPVNPDGFDEEFPPRPFYNLSALQPDGVLLPANATLSRTLSLGPGSLPSLSTRVFAWIPPPEFLITAIAIPTNGIPRIEHTSDTNSYFILLAGNQITNITLAAGMAIGSGAFGILFDPSTTNSQLSTKFYRVRKVPIAQPLDSDNDGIDDVWELDRAAPPYPLNPLDPTDAGLDPDGNGLTHLQEYLGAVLPLTIIAESSPANGESGVANSRETIFRFNHPLSPNTLLSTNNLRATFAGRQILARIEFSSDRKKVTLFYQEPLPASARVRVTFNGTNLVDYLDRALDLDGDGQPGGNAIVDFDTLSITPVAGTAVIGHIYASVQVPVVSTNSTTNFVDHPLPGVLVSVIGAEQEIFTTTDAQGFFRLTNCPAGKFFVSIDGRTSPESSWPNGAYYPLVGKPWEAVAGRTNNLAGGTGLIYLPLVQAGTLQPVNPTADTTIGFPANIIAANPAWAGVSVTIPTNALYSDNGTRGGRVGLAPVPSDRLPERLPAGIVHALDISIQTDGPQNVDRPLPVRFPNLPDPETGLKLPPGAKSALMSYNHDTGRWEVQGPMTVTADGNYVETDPGVGVRQPGWHGVMPGTQGDGGEITEPPPPCNTPPTCVASSSLSGGTAKASHVNTCAGKTISFEATGVIPHPGTLEACDGTTFATSGSPIEYKWEISVDGTQFATGAGSTATVSAAQPGSYVCTFTVALKDECPSTDRILTSPAVSVAAAGANPNDIDCDGIPNSDDFDINGDGQPNGSDDDMDGDGIPNDQDPDRDGDGIPNDQDPNPDGPECSNPNAPIPTIRIVGVSGSRAWFSDPSRQTFLSTDELVARAEVQNACTVNVRWTVIGKSGTPRPVAQWLFPNEDEVLSFRPKNLQTGFGSFTDYRSAVWTGGCPNPGCANEPIEFDLKAELVDDSGNVLADSLLSNEPISAGRLVQDIIDRLRQEYADYGLLVPSVGAVGPAYSVPNFDGSEFSLNSNYHPYVLNGGMQEVAKAVRDLFGASIRINSAYRNPQRNRAVGGALNSDHMLGGAVDMAPVSGNDVRDKVALYRAAVNSNPGRVLLEVGAVQLLPKNWFPPSAPFVRATGNSLVDFIDSDNDGLPDKVGSIRGAPQSGVSSSTTFPYAGGGSSNPVFTVGDQNSNGKIDVGVPLLLRHKPSNTSLQPENPLRAYFLLSSHTHAND